MHKFVVAGVALALMAGSLAMVPEASARNAFRPAHAGLVVTEAHIARLKAALRLTPEQEKLWPAVQTALREVVRAQHEQRPQLELASTGGGSSNLDDKISRAAAAALPLIAVLDEQQKKSALRFARSLGLGNLASVF
jgi:hypothetical protein